MPLLRRACEKGLAMDPIRRLFVRLHVKRKKLGDDALSHQEHVVVDVMGLEAQVMNGGLHQFFFNDAGDRAAQSVSALREIGAAAAAAIVAEACSRFPGGAPASDRLRRQRQLEALAFETFRDLDKRFSRYPEKVVQQLARYWTKHGHSNA